MENQIVIVDTDIVINHVKNASPILENLLRLKKRNKLDLFISSITLFEYYSGIDYKDIEVYQETELLFKQFSIQPVTDEIAKKAARINRESKLHQHIELADILIGSTALYLNAQLLTENKKHFKLIPGIRFAR